MAMYQFLVIGFLLLLQANAFSIPGVSIQEYKVGDNVTVYANEMTSIQTQLNFPYYYLEFCGKDIFGKTTSGGSLGSSLLGETTQTTAYNITMGQNITCRHLCTKNLQAKEVENFKWIIQRDYSVNLVVDNLPALYHQSNRSHIGFPLGKVNGKDDVSIYNHLTFIIDVFEVSNVTKRIVGFEVIPKSVAGFPINGSFHGFCETNSIIGEKNTDHRLPAKATGGPVAFSYEVIFRNSTKRVATRWDSYKALGGENIHWLSILNSFVINIFLTTLIGCILKKTVGSDIRMYNELRTSEDIQEDSGWKQLSRDVFRPPKHALFLSVLVGTGVQVASMCFLTLICACLGFMDQDKRGSIVTTILLFYILVGFFAGFYSARVYKMYNGPHWIRCALTTAFFYPGVNFIAFYAVNFVISFENSSNAFRPETIFTLIVLWVFIAVPLVLFGSLVGFKKQTVQNPCKYNPIPKFVKPQPWYLNQNLLCILGGLLPFGSIFIELHFIMASVWHHSFYYLFAFLFGVLIILVVTSAEISIVITYLQLCNGNHRIWWRSFFNTASIAIYILLYSFFYYHQELSTMVRFSSIILYFGYMLVMSLTVAIFCGTVGFIASYWFVRQIYSSIRID